MDVTSALEESYDQTAKLVTGLTPAELGAPSPCAGWDVRATLNHLLGATWMFTLVNQGQAADEDAGDRGIGNDVLDIMGEATTGEEGGELFFPVGAFCTDIFQPDVEMSQNGIETGHAMDAESDEGVVFLCVEERGLKVFFLSVMIKSL